jgi:hypothetical protein
MDDLIYILLGIAWIIYVAYRANQKQKRKAQASSPPRPQPQRTYEQQPKPIETIFRELMGEEDSLEKQFIPQAESYEDQESYDELAIKDLEQGKKQFSKLRSILETIPSEEGVSGFDSSGRHTDHLFSSLADETKETAIRDGLHFDLRKAIIYTEILNRPYA